MNPIITAILGAAAELAVPRVKDVLTERFGENGKLAGQVVEKVAQKAGVPIEALPKIGTDALQKAILDAEPETADMLDRYLRGQELSNETIALDYQKEQWWAWGWRPAWMWLLGLLWLYHLVIQPLLHASVLPALTPFASSDLLAVSGIFMTLYMGGHTAKKVIAPSGR